MSTLHHVNEVSNRNDKKPQIILDYNASKKAVDTLYQVTYTYTCKRKTKRWAVIFFYNILDVSAYNAYVLWTSIDPNWNANKLTRRRLFLEELEKSLTKEHISSRKHFSRTEEAIRIVKNIQNPKIVTTVSESTRGKTVKRERCEMSPGPSTESYPTFARIGLRENPGKNSTSCMRARAFSSSEEDVTKAVRRASVARVFDSSVCFAHVMSASCLRPTSEPRPVYVFFVVDWNKLTGILKKIGVDWKDRRLFCNLYMKQRVKVRIGEEMSEGSEIGRGVREGSPLSPT
ncbi:hypothetical protein ANN_00469 [Periplaneta americana]|uniref:PiggyBac transposable element-derived protein domain-containing protein n=1 Tax=Periplaneta americana TaxID=6978 RepID=A0ABQ8TU37_PERAM|nr:hypothetical protein ANN_00469 [Periplaneta americana]